MLFFCCHKVLQSLIDIISSNRKDAKFKQSLLPALGELMYFIARQEGLIGKIVDTWAVPSLAYVLLIRNIGVNKKATFFTKQFRINENQIVFIMMFY